MTDTENVGLQVNRLCELADRGNPFARYVLSELRLRIEMALELTGEVAAIRHEIVAPIDVVESLDQ